MKNESKLCPHCNRNNWHENINCSWCNRKLPNNSERFMNHLMALIVIVSMVAIAIQLWYDK